MGKAGPLTTLPLVALSTRASRRGAELQAAWQTEPPKAIVPQPQICSPGTLTFMACTCACCCGACCYEGGECTDETEANCAAYGGEWKGKETACIENPCGCTTDDDCCGSNWYYTNSGVTNGPYDTASDCAAAALADCAGGDPLTPTCPCFCDAIDPYCCSGICQSEPCLPP